MDFVLSEKEVMVRNARLFLKGYIVQLSINGGMKYRSLKTPTPWFEAGQKSVEDTDFRISATTCHIVHNMTRHNKPHTGSLERDQEFLAKYFGYEKKALFKLLTKTFGDQVLENLGLEVPIQTQA